MQMLAHTRTYIIIIKSSESGFIRQLLIAFSGSSRLDSTENKKTTFLSNWKYFEVEKKQNTKSTYKQEISSCIHCLQFYSWVYISTMGKWREKNHYELNGHVFHVWFVHLDDDEMNQTEKKYLKWVNPLSKNWNLIFPLKFGRHTRTRTRTRLQNKNE